MRVRCINAKICNEKMCLHQQYHKDDHDVGYNDVVICSKQPIYCPIIRAFTLCAEKKIIDTLK